MPIVVLKLKEKVSFSTTIDIFFFWIFDHFFNHLSLFTIEDTMKIEPENFETEIDIII